MQSVIGALRVNLGLDTSRFTESLAGTRASLAKWGQDAQKIGASLSARLTAPIAAAGAAVAASVVSMTGGLADLSNQAKLANAGTDEFQKLAYAARTVGIEQDKLSDILKDVNDKVGDFLATGGGEMAAFFENVAPKIGLTAEAFRGLSGPDALQLYVSSLEKAGLSQAEMTFYMEGIADEATALIPLLANGGAEYARLAGQAEKFGLASAGSIAQSVAFRQAMSDLGEAIRGIGYALVDAGILDAITGIVGRLTEWAIALRDVDPALVKFGVGVAAIAAAVGPLLIGLGLAATAIAAIGAPIALAVVGIGTLTAAVVAFWPQIVAAKDAVIQFGRDALDWIRQKLVDMEAAVAGLRDRFVQIGRDIIDGLLAGLRERWEAVRAWFAGLADAIPQWVRDKLGIQSPSTVFAEIGGHVMEGLRQGLGAEMGTVQEELGAFAESLGQTFAQLLTQGGSFRDSMRGLLGSVLGGLSSKLASGGFGLLGKAIGIPGFASGTNFAPGGLAWVGERGRELVNLPKGSQVIPNHRLPDLMQEPRDVRVVVGVDPRTGNLTGYVDDRIDRAAPGIQRGAVGAVQTGARKSRKFLGR